MRHTHRRRVLIPALLTLAVTVTMAVVAPTAASAAASSHGIAYTNGTRAAEGWFNPRDGSHGNRAWIDLYDAKCDASEVYVETNKHRELLTNNGGCGTTTGFNMPAGSYTMEYRVCVNDGVVWDTCSNWITDHT